MSEQQKTCARCKVPQDKSCFHRCKRNKDGLYSCCKSCNNDLRRQGYLKNKQNAIEYAKNWQKNNKDHWNEYQKMRKRVYRLGEQP